ncbi:hydrogenase maturation nickel metallochaperone HypA [Propionivibrio limicola]|uniref:hydrogenase maturation nickel metallochaperone HypA n=1 Tax=Propionivibrio limicola TaxID=167645 RepID=UPI001291FD95|nr:hydrogenase maturation nickel metallochaperone HypA [Propionivibrio limicola]
MHEMSLAEGVLQIIEETAEVEGFQAVRKVTLEIGQLAAVEPEAMRFCFDAAMRGSLAEGAELEIVEVPGSGWCVECATTVPMPEIIAACPYCGNCQLQATGGMEMKVTSLEVE